jgi:2-(1,2-epoxy-1,2-dihydrophenyl)acetyl-CoA isomerase
VNPILYEVSGGVARITLNRPNRLNALTNELCSELSEALREAEAPEVRVVVLRGAGRAFCAGTDLATNFEPGQPSAEANLRASRHPLLLAMRALPKPVITAVNGIAAGIGVGIALAGDVIVARKSTQFVLAFAKVGLIPDGGVSWFLPRAIGRPRALRAALFGDTIDGATALELGLVSYCTEDDRFDAELDALASRLAAGPTRAYGLMKQAFDASPDNGLASQMEFEARLQAEAARTADFGEGRAAFADKREPRFVGA